MFLKFKNRYIAALCALVVMFVFLGVQLFSLTVTHADEYASETRATTQRSVAVKGARGTIMDRSGVPLAYDVGSYNVAFYRDPANNASSDRANYTSILSKAIEVIERHGGTTIDTFLIKKNEEGVFEYDLDGLTEEQKQRRIENWCANMQITDTSAEPEQLYYELRNRFRIPQDASYEQAIKLLSIWQEVQNMMYKSYIPVTIAYDVDFNTVSELETRAVELEGIQIEQSYTRVYPKKSTAAHIIGYLGRITDTEELAEKEAQGYSADDLVGKVGIEATMEHYLSGATLEKQGERVLELNEEGSVTQQVSYQAPEQGDSVVLTIDLELQELVERELEANIKLDYQEQQQMYEEGRADTETREGYDTILANRAKKEIDFVKSGAAIVMDVDTGDVLALASYPSYDLNLFTGGISDEDYNALVNDPAAPLFNNAISSVSTPGSIFKMATAVAGLMEGEITVDTVIDDAGPYNKYVQEGARAPECWVSPNFSHHSGGQNVVLALKNSCNYFFYEVADRLGIDRLMQWADNFGLTSKTNIQLTNEAVGWIGNQDILYDPDLPIDEQRTNKPTLVYNRIYEQLQAYGEERGVTYSEEQLKLAATELVDLARLGRLDIGPEIRQVLSDTLDIPQNVSLRRGWTNDILNWLRELIWTSTDTVTQGIGVTPTQLTPIAVARYLCALANGGKVYEANIVDKIIDSQGNVVEDFEPVLVRDLEFPQEVQSAIMEGMEQVVSAEDGGTAGAAFSGFAYSDQIVGKTGTAPISTIDIEDNIWLCLLAPKEDPEIAVVVFLPNGFSTSKAYPTAKAIISYYFESQNAQQGQEPAPSEGTLLQ